MQDELAENALPDPGYAGTSWELEQTFWDYDLFDYWDDLEYGDDGYWDAGGAAAGQKRRRTKRSGAVKELLQKRRKLSLRDTSGDTSIFVSMQERRRLWSGRAPMKKGLKAFALLPDWRKRCAQADRTVAVKAMPAEMRHAAEANVEDAEEAGRQVNEAFMRYSPRSGRDDDDVGGMIGDPDALITGMAEIAGLDFNTLEANMKNVINQKLGESGLQMTGKDKLFELATKMMSGDPTADDAVSDLARGLMGAAEQAEQSTTRVTKESSSKDTLDRTEGSMVDAAAEHEADWEDEDEEEKADTSALGDVNPEVLQTVLRQKLGDAGLGDMSETAFMEAIQNMLAGGGGAGDAMGDLANSLLGQGHDSAASDWLTQQGVSLEIAAVNEEDDDADCVAPAEFLVGSASSHKGKSVRISPPDSAVEMGGRGTSQLPLHDGSPKAAKKRLASMAVAGDDDASAHTKRKKVTFDVPASQENIIDSAQESSQIEPAKEAASDHVSNAADLAVQAEPPTDDAQTAFASIETSKTSHSGVVRGAEVTAATAVSNYERTTPAARFSATKVTDKGDAAGMPSDPAKSTRKRKAHSNENQPSPPPAKKQTRKAGATTKEAGKVAANEEEKPSYARPTRATRARSGK